jgi:hypothetical protein
MSAKEICAPDAERLLASARSARTPLGENVAGMLGKLYATVPAVGIAIRSLAAGKRAHERVNAVVALSPGPVTELHIQLFTHLLSDKSARVRTLAADKIVQHGLVQLSGTIEAAMNKKTDPKIIAELSANLDALRQGYHTSAVGDSIWVTCRPPQAASISRLFTRQEYEAQGSSWVTEVLRQPSIAA